MASNQHIEMMPSSLPEPAFQEHVSGLYVPRSVVRERQVWTSQERQILNRATKLIESRGLMLQLACQKTECQRTPLERIENPDGGFTLRCRHADRVFQKHA